MSIKGKARPAFPLHPDDLLCWTDGDLHPSHGMSLRDYFAGKALNGLLAQFQGRANGVDPMHHATWSYAMADAMLAAREANK